MPGSRLWEGDEDVKAYKESLHKEVFEIGVFQE